MSYALDAATLASYIPCTPSLRTLSLSFPYSYLTLGGDLDKDNLGWGSTGLDARDPCSIFGVGGRGTKVCFDEGDRDAAGGLGEIDSSGDAVSFSRGVPNDRATLGIGDIVLGDSSNNIKMSVDS
jgi:hypothetical protein